MNPARILRMALLAALCCGLYTPARAQEEVPPAKSPSGALTYSLLGTFVPVCVGVGIGLTGSSSSTGEEAQAAAVVVSAAGLLVGPSLGHFYAERWGRGLAGIGIRAVGAAGVVGGIAMEWNNPEGDNSDGIIAAGCGLILGSIIWDVASAPHAARDWNRDAANHRVSVRPAVVGQARAPGLRLDVVL